MWFCINWYIWYKKNYIFKKIFVKICRPLNFYKLVYIVHIIIIIGKYL